MADRISQQHTGLKFMLITSGITGTLVVAALLGAQDAAKGGKNSQGAVKNSPTVIGLASLPPIATLYIPQSDGGSPYIAPTTAANSLPQFAPVPTVIAPVIPESVIAAPSNAGSVMPMAPAASSGSSR